ADTQRPGLQAQVLPFQTHSPFDQAYPCPGGGGGGVSTKGTGGGGERSCCWSMDCPMRPPVIKPAAPPINAPTPGWCRAANAPMLAPPTPPTTAPVPALLGAPLGVV